MTTKNKILTSVVDSVFFIPIEAIFNADSVAFVYRKDGSSAVKQQVIVGQSNDNEIIIRAGLTTDDEVLLVPPEKADKLKLERLPADIIAKFRKKPSKPKTEKTANRPSGTQTPGTPVIMKK